MVLINQEQLLILMAKYYFMDGNWLLGFFIKVLKSINFCVFDDHRRNSNQFKLSRAVCIDYYRVHIKVDNGGNLFFALRELVISFASSSLVKT